MGLLLVNNLTNCIHDIHSIMVIKLHTFSNYYNLKRRYHFYVFVCKETQATVFVSYCTVAIDDRHTVAIGCHTVAIQSPYGCHTVAIQSILVAARSIGLRFQQLIIKQ